jgi:ribosomal protein S18 acetylase RimI-like enzyme
VRAGARRLDVTIRSVSIDDLDALVDIYLAGARRHAELDPAAFRVPERADCADRLRRRIETLGDMSAYVAAVVDGQLAGSATTDVADAPHPGAMANPIPTAVLGIAVLEAWRGHGLGHLLNGHLEAWAAERGIERMTLEVSETNEGAIRLYHELGYTETGREMRKELVAR